MPSIQPVKVEWEVPAQLACIHSSISRLPLDVVAETCCEGLASSGARGSGLDLTSLERDLLLADGDLDCCLEAVLSGFDD
jgi:hypothetical protein